MDGATNLGAGQRRVNKWILDVQPQHLRVRRTGSQPDSVREWALSWTLQGVAKHVWLLSVKPNASRVSPRTVCLQLQAGRAGNLSALPSEKLTGLVSALHLDLFGSLLGFLRQGLNL